MMKKWSILAVVLAALTLCAVLALLFFQTLSPGERYEKAEKLLELGELEAAAKSFTALGEYKDSAARAAEIREALAEGRSAETPAEPQSTAAPEPETQSAATTEPEAQSAATPEPEGQSAATPEPEAQSAEAYTQAEALLRAEDYAGAAAAFEALGEYEDSAARAAEAREAQAEAQREAEREAENAAAYARAEALLTEENYAQAVPAFEALGEYRDSAALAAEAREALDATPYGKALIRAAELGLPEPPDIDVSSWEYTLVNGEHSIDRYEPEQLAYLNLTLADTEIRTEHDGNRQSVDIRIAEPLIAMCSACRDAGLPVYLSSGYRSYSVQAANFQRICQNNGVSDGKDGAGHYITMPPGCSEHQLALCCDITDRYYETKTPEKVASPTIDWLLEHCAEYGFVQRFPSGKEDITGVMNETWHFRYVGVEAAVYMTENHLCLEEFLALYGVE